MIYLVYFGALSVCLVQFYDYLSIFLKSKVGVILFGLRCYFKFLLNGYNCKIKGGVKPHFKTYRPFTKFVLKNS